MTTITDPPVNATALSAFNTFEKYIKNTHVMTVLRDDNGYRHLRFQNPASSEYWFDIITWPRNLHVGGDIETWHWSLYDNDVLPIFNQRRINPYYWHEKLSAPQRTAAKPYSAAAVQDTMTELVADAIGDDFTKADGDNVLEQMRDAGGFEAHYYIQAYEILNREWVADSGATFEAHDLWESEFAEYDFHYLLACHAVRWGTRTYYEAKAAERTARSRAPRRINSRRPRL